MIDIRELRIGSAVKGNGCKDICFIAGIPCRKEEQNEWATLIHPVPLNDELLSKCGFKFSGNHVWEYKDDSNLLFDAPNDWDNVDSYYPIGISAIKIGYPALYIPHGEIIIRSLYLHDLQNKFFAITGKELEVKL